TLAMATRPPERFREGLFPAPLTATAPGLSLLSVFDKSGTGGRMTTPTVAASSLSLAAAMFLAFPDGEAPGPPAAPSAPDHAVARVNGQELQFQQFEEWLVHAHGWRHLDDYVDLALLRQEATRLSIPLPTAADLDAEFERDWQVRVEMRGDEAALLAELARA